MYFGVRLIRKLIAAMAGIKIDVCVCDVENLVFALIEKRERNQTLLKVYKYISIK